MEIVRINPSCDGTLFDLFYMKALESENPDSVKVILGTSIISVGKRALSKQESAEIDETYHRSCLIDDIA